MEVTKRTTTQRLYVRFESHFPDSNRGPTHYECVALPTEPKWHRFCCSFAKAGAKVLQIFEIHKYFVKKIAFILIFIALTAGMCAQTHTRVFKERVRTLRVAREVLLLEDPAPLHISFDEMSHDVHMYTYTVKMLNSDLMSNEYLEGFTTRDIVDYEHSINTTRE